MVFMANLTTTYYIQYLLANGYTTNIGDQIMASPASNIWEKYGRPDTRIHINSNYLRGMTITTATDWYDAQEIIKRMTQLGLMLDPDVIARLWIIRKYLIMYEII